MHDADRYDAQFARNQPDGPNAYHYLSHSVFAVASDKNTNPRPLFLKEQHDRQLEADKPNSWKIAQVAERKRRSLRPR